MEKETGRIVNLKRGDILNFPLYEKDRINDYKVCLGGREPTKPYEVRVTKNNTTQIVTK